MSLLSTLTSDASIADEKDTVGGGNSPLESGVYNMNIAMAYINKAASGALGLVLTLKTADNKEVRQTLWMSSGTAKGCKNFYEKDGEKHYLPGYTQANNLCLLVAAKEISAMDTETKVIKLYSSEAKAEVPTKVEVLVDLIGKEIIVGLIKQTVDKTVKNDQGVYVVKCDPITGLPETRDENEVDKLFRATDRLTTAEIRAHADEASFIDTWEAKWTGKTKVKAKGASGTAGAPKLSGMAATNTAKKPTASLFG